MPRKLIQAQVLTNPLIDGINSLTDSLTVSSDETHIAIASASAVGQYLYIYKNENGKFIRLPNPDVPPSSNAYSVAFSPDGTHLAVGLSSTPAHLVIYRRIGDTFTRITTVYDVAPGATPQWLEYSPDGTHLILGLPSSPYIVIYKRNGDAYTKLTNPATVPGGAMRGMSFSSDGVYLAVGLSGGQALFIYKREGDTFTKLANPTSMPSGDCRDLSFSPDGVYLAIPSDTSPYLHIYKRNGDIFTKLPNVATYNGTGAYAVAWSPDSTKLIVNHNAGGIISIFNRSDDVFTKTTTTFTGVTGSGRLKQSHNLQYVYNLDASKPYFKIFKRDDITGNYSNIAIDSNFPAALNNLELSRDSNYLFVAGTNPIVGIYKRDKSNKLTKLPNLPGFTSSQAYAIELSPDGTHLAIGTTGNGTTSPTLWIYRKDGDTFTKLANPSGQIGAVTKIAYSQDSMYLASGTTGDVLIYKRDGDTYILLPSVDIKPGTPSDLRFSPDGKYLTCNQPGAPFTAIYKRGLDDRFTRLPALPSGPATYSKSADWSPDGKLLVVSNYNSTGFMAYRVEANDVFTKLTVPNLTIGIVQSVRFSLNGQYLIVLGAADPFIAIYEVIGETFTLISKNIMMSSYGDKISSSKNHIAINHFAESPYASIYEWERLIKFLIKDGNDLKKVSNNVWTTVGVASDAYSRVTFETHGMSDLSVITNDTMQQLISEDPELITWKGVDEGIVVPNVRIVDQLIPRVLKQKDNVYTGGADSFRITATEDGGNIRVILSDDNGTTWKGKGAVSITDPVSVKTNGWTVTELNALSRVVIQSITDKYKLKFAFYMEQVNVDLPLSITNFEVKTYEGWIPLGNVIPDGNTFTFSGLDNFSIVPAANFDSQFEVVAKRLNTTDPLDISVKSVAFGQLITPKGDIKITEVTNIDLFTLSYTKSGSGNIRTAVSFDSGVTWKGLNGSSFTTMNINTQMNTYGITPEAFNAITATQWNTLKGASETVRFAYFIEMANTADVAEVNTLTMQADMVGMWEMATPGIDYKYIYARNNELRISLLTDGSFKINY